jgi:hypothetical protein
MIRRVRVDRSTWTKGISKVAANLGSHVAKGIGHITNLDLHPLIEGGLPPCEIAQLESVRHIPPTKRLELPARTQSDRRAHPGGSSHKSTWAPICQRRWLAGRSRPDCLHTVKTCLRMAQSCRRNCIGQEVSWGVQNVPGKDRGPDCCKTETILGQRRTIASQVARQGIREISRAPLDRRPRLCAMLHTRLPLFDVG